MLLLLLLPVAAAACCCMQNLPMPPPTFARFQRIEHTHTQLTYVSATGSQVRQADWGRRGNRKAQAGEQLQGLWQASSGRGEQGPVQD